jgi:hypothetical protein
LSISLLRVAAAAGRNLAVVAEPVDSAQELDLL